MAPFPNQGDTRVAGTRSPNRSKVYFLVSTAKVTYSPSVWLIQWCCFGAPAFLCGLLAAHRFDDELFSFNIYRDETWIPYLEGEVAVFRHLGWNVNPHSSVLVVLAHALPSNHRADSCASHNEPF